MGTPQRWRFRVNPVEIVIFSVVALIFAHSLYSLFQERHTFEANTLAPMAANPIRSGKGDADDARDLASSSLSLRPITLKNCEYDGKPFQAAARVVITSDICGIKKPEDLELIQEIKVTAFNSMNKADAPEDKGEVTGIFWSPPKAGSQASNDKGGAKLAEAKLPTFRTDAIPPPARIVIDIIRKDGTVFTKEVNFRTGSAN